MTKNIIKIILSVLLPLYMFISFFSFDGKKENEICRDISITIKDSAISSFLKIKDVENSLKNTPAYPVGKYFKDINTHEIRKQLEKNRVIKNAVCYITPAGDLNIDIYQRKPILRVMGINGDYYLDDNCEIMPVSANFTAHLPIASGYVNKEIINNGLFEFAKYINKDNFWNIQIEQIYVNAGGEVELIPRVGEHNIILGSFDNFEEKLDNLFDFYKKGLNKKGWNLYKSISLKYENQVIGIK